MNIFWIECLFDEMPQKKIFPSFTLSWWNGWNPVRQQHCKVFYSRKTSQIAQLNLYICQQHHRCEWKTQTQKKHMRSNLPTSSPSGLFHQPLADLPQLFSHSSVSGEGTQSGRSAVDEVTPVVFGCFLWHSAVDDGLSPDLTRHEKHPHDHLHQHAEQDGVVARPAALDQTWRHKERVFVRFITRCVFRLENVNLLS